MDWIHPKYARGLRPRDPRQALAWGTARSASRAPRTPAAESVLPRLWPVPAARTVWPEEWGRHDPATCRRLSWITFGERRQWVEAQSLNYLGMKYITQAEQRQLCLFESVQVEEGL